MGFICQKFALTKGFAGFIAWGPSPPCSWFYSLCLRLFRWEQAAILKLVIFKKCNVNTSQYSPGRFGYFFFLKIKTNESVTFWKWLKLKFLSTNDGPLSIFLLHNLIMSKIAFRAWNSNFHYRFHKSLPLDFSWGRWIQCVYYLFQNYFNIILSSMLVSSEWTLSSNFWLKFTVDYFESKHFWV